MPVRSLPINVVSAAHMLVTNNTSRDLCFFSLESTMVEHVDDFRLTRAALSSQKSFIFADSFRVRITDRAQAHWRWRFYGV